MTWNKAEAAWSAFLAEIEEHRSKLKCTWSNAWFRGLEDSSYALKPTLLRRDWHDIPRAERNRSRTENVVPPARTIDPSFASLSLRRKYLRNEMKALAADDSKKAELELAKIEYWKLKNKEHELKLETNKNLEADKRRLDSLLRSGERDAFINYQFRAGVVEQNSWQTLAEMQHNGVPTRLLDWTDVLATALYFALKRFRTRLEKYWFDEREAHPNESIPIGFPPESVTSSLATPVLCILNPYRLARYSSKRNRIWDLTLDRDLDYYNCFIEQKKWDFEDPIPIYSPWKNERIAAQRGMFLVWGYNRDALEDIVKRNGKETKIVQRVKINQLAAIYGVKHIRQFLGLDRFAMYRDLDALGSKVRREFLRDAQDKEEDFD